jgi:CshA-type fibril repeat protein
MKLQGKAMIAATISMVFSTLFPISASMAAQVSCTASPGYTNCIRITYSGSDQSFTVPASYVPGSPLVVETWGAGGGGSTYFGAYTPNSGGAAGGYSKTVLSNVNIGDTFTVVVGQGGIFNGTSSNAYGGGGKYGTTTGTAKGSGGGGFSGIFLDSAKTEPVIVAGGGGGASPGSNGSGVPGGGGGIGAAPATGAESGKPGTLSTGGAGATFQNCTAPTAGAAYLGGTGAGTGEAGGGGGGGYFGGGGGACQNNGSQNGGGGGGSGYLLTSKAKVIASGNGASGILSGIARPATVGTTLPASGGQYVAGIGVGGGGDTGSSGGNGMVVFQWSTTTQPTFTCDATFYSMQNATLKKMSLSSTPRQPYWTATWTSVGAAGSSNFAAIAYNEYDNFIYGTNGNNQLVRIGSDGSQRVLDTLGDSMDSYLGANVNSSGTYLSDGILFFEGSTATNAYTFKVDTTTILPTVSLVGNINPLQSGITDFSMINGFGYGIHSATANLIKVDTSSGSHAAGVALPGWTATGYGATWTDGTNLFAQSTDLTKLYQISNLGTPVVKQVAGSATTTLSTFDGANCSTGGSPFPTMTAPTLVADTSNGVFNTAQTISPLSNDLANGQTATFGSNELNGSTVKICLNSTTDANCLAGAAANALSTITVANQGTYKVQASGAVLFAPLATFYGTATPIKYIVADTNGQYGVTTITASVAEPGLSVANPDTTIGKMNTSQNMDFVQNNDSAPAGVTLDPTTVKLCTSAQVGGSCTTGGGGIVTLNATQGSYQLTTNGNGRIAFTPNAAFAGTASPVTYQIKDSVGRTIWSTYTPTVVGLPILANDTSTGVFGATQTISVLSNDNAYSGGTLDATSVKICTSATATASCTATSLVVPNQGSYSVNANGTITFKPCTAANTPTMTPACTAAFANTGGAVTTAIKYVVADNYAQRSSATITPSVSAPAISATSQSKSVLPSSSVSFTSITDASGLASGTGLVTSGTGVTCLYNTSTTTCSSNNSVTISGAGTYTLVPATGVVTFSALAGVATGSVTPVRYRVTDAVGQTATGTLTALVPPPPSASNDSSSGAMNAVQTIAVTSNDAAGSASAPLAPSTVRLCATTATANTTCLSANLTSVTVSGQGTYTANANGTITLVPVNNYHGTASAVKYIVQDSLGQVASAQIQAIVSPPPATRAATDSASTAFNTALVFSPFANDSVEMPNGFPTYTTVGSASLVNSSVRLCDSQSITPGVNSDDINCTGTSVTTSAGTYEVNTTSGTITFTPTSGFIGTDSTPPVYGICDTVSGWAPVVYSTCASAPLIATVLAPAPPTANADTSVGPLGANQSIDPLANDVTANGVTTVATSVKLCAANQTVAANCSLTSLTTVDGTYEVNVATGFITFTPAVDFTGDATVTVFYAMTDSAGGKGRASLVPTVVAPPVATDKTSSAAGGTTQSTTVSIPAGGTATLVDGSGNPVSSLVVNGGTYSISGGVITFTPNAGFSGTAPAATYKLTDEYGQSDTATYAATAVAPAGPNPESKTSSAPGGQDQSTTISIPAGGSITLLDANNDPVTTLVVAGGTYTLNPGTGEITFVPNTGFSGSPTPVSFEVTDLYGQSATSTYSPSVVAPAAPTVTNKTSTALAELTQTAQVALVGSNTVTLMDGQTPTSGPVAVNGGSYSINSSGLITFTPNQGFTGTAGAVTYKVTDIYGSSSTASYTATVTAPAGPNPEPKTSSAGGGQNQSTFAAIPAGGSITLLDANNNPVTTLVVAGGTYTLDDVTGEIIFAPIEGFSGDPSPANFRVTDLYGQSATETYSPTVVAPPAPSVSNKTSSGLPGQTQTTQVSLVGSNTVTLMDGPTPTAGPVVVNGGSYSIDSSGLITFTPNPGFNGTAGAVTYKVTDIYGSSSTATYRASVTAIPGPNPVSKTSSAGGGQNQSTSVSIPTGGSVALLDANDNPVTTLVVAGGTYSLDAATGQITFVPNPGFSGDPTPATFQVTDSYGQSGTATYSPTVVAPAAPIVSNKNSTGFPFQAQTTQIELVGSNTATLMNGQTPTAGPVLVNGGSYSIDSSGLITFTPNAGFAGTAGSVTYKVTDIYGSSSTATYTATVTPPAGPVANNLSSSALAGTVQSQTVSVPVGCTVTLLNSSNQPVTSLTVAGGTYSLDPATGVITFTPTAGFAGTPPAVNYRLTDAYSQSSVGTYSPVVTYPAGPTQSALTSEGTGTGVQSATATIPAGGSVTLLDSNNNPTTSVKVVGGTYVLNPVTGVITFTPDAGFVGTAPAVPVRVIDIYGQEANSTYTATVLGSSATNVATGSQVPVKINPALNGISGAQKCLVNPSTGNCGNSVTISGVGTFVLNANGTTTFTPASGFVGTATVDYKVTLPSGLSSTAPINVEVAPLVELVVTSTNAETAVVVEPELPPSSTRCLVVSAESTCANTIAISGVGRFTLTTNGKLKFVPYKGFVGVATVFIKFTSNSSPNQFSKCNVTVQNKARGPVTITIGNFRDGSPILTQEIKAKIRAFILKYDDYDTMECVGYTEGPTILSVDPALAKARGVNACAFALKIDDDLTPITTSGRNLTVVGSEYRRVVITLRDK